MASKSCESYLTKEKSVVSLTFRECVENHAGMQMIGKTVLPGEGLSMKELYSIMSSLESKYRGLAKIELFDLKAILLEQDVDVDDAIVPDAGFLVIRNGVDLLFRKGVSDSLFTEQTTLETDKKMFAYGRVVDKNIRHNLCFADVDQSADFENKKGTIVSFNGGRIPHLKRLRDNLGTLIHPKFHNSYAEGNYYYDKMKCAIRAHGDTEARKVLCVRLGADFPLCYQWYRGASGGTPIGERIDVTLSHGDIYIMSEEAVGTEWKNHTTAYRSKFTLRHSAGFDSMLVQKKKVEYKEGYVTNPLTGKLIKVGGPTHKKLVKSKTIQ